MNGTDFNQMILSSISPWTWMWAGFLTVAIVAGAIFLVLFLDREKPVGLKPSHLFLGDPHVHVLDGKIVFHAHRAGANAHEHASLTSS